VFLLIISPLVENNLSIYFVSLVFGFICGSIPFGFLIARIKGVDIRNVGSKNIGFTNVYRMFGWRFAVPVLLLDIAKGFLPTFFSPQLVLIPSIVAVGAILGHIYTPWLKFKGGKGVATTLGAVVALKPCVLLIGLGIFIIIFFAFSYVSLASLAFAISLPITVTLMYPTQKLLILIATVVSILIIIRHIGNIKRLIAKTESKTYLLKFLEFHK